MSLHPKPSLVAAVENFKNIGLTLWIQYILRADSDVSNPVWTFSGILFFPVAYWTCRKFHWRTCMKSLISGRGRVSKLWYRVAALYQSWYMVAAKYQNFDTLPGLDLRRTLFKNFRPWKSVQDSLICTNLTSRQARIQLDHINSLRVRLIQFMLSGTLSQGWKFLNSADLMSMSTQQRTYFGKNVLILINRVFHLKGTDTFQTLTYAYIRTSQNVDHSNAFNCMPGKVRKEKLRIKNVDFAKLLPVLEQLLLTAASFFLI